MLNNNLYFLGLHPVCICWFKINNKSFKTWSSFFIDGYKEILFFSLGTITEAYLGPSRTSTKEIYENN